MSGVFFVNANPPFHFASGGKIIISIYYIPEARCVELPQFHSGKNISERWASFRYQNVLFQKGMQRPS